MHFAVTKSSIYIKGADTFTVATDHRPLEGIFKKDLFEILNPRVQTKNEKLEDSAFSQVDFEKAAMVKDKKFEAQSDSYNRGKVDLPMLVVGQVMRVQEEKTGLWTISTRGAA